VDPVRGRHDAVIRLIALDVDGTLLDSRWQVPQANQSALLAAAALGVEVVLVTGRRFEFALPVVEQLACPITLILNNGAIVKTRDGRTLIRHLLPAGTARAILDATATFRETAAVVFDRARGPQVIYERLDSSDPHRLAYIARNQGAVAAIEPLDACLTEDPLQLMFTGQVGPMRDLFAVLRSVTFADRFSVSVTEYELRDFSLVDICQQGCSKGTTLAEWAARRGVERHEILAIGDNLNDREMLAFAGVPVVMGNAVAALKETGWPVTLSNDESGVAEAIGRFVLGRPPGAVPRS
jgi:Cof subfamily protein (haloacid dehalogenase superfamily)